jgi:hypothetical protein
MDSTVVQVDHYRKIVKMRQCGLNVEVMGGVRGGGLWLHSH